MKFQPVFYEIKLPNKDIKVVINYAHECNAYFTYAHNNIANTFYGLQCESFIGAIRGLIRLYPNFFNDISESDYRKDLNKMGIIEIDAPEIMKKIYQ